MLTSAVATSPDRRSYAFLIERLLPRHLLSETRRARLDSALAQNDRVQLYGEALEALLDFEALGIFHEMPSHLPDTRVFQRTGSADCVRLSRPRQESQQASRPARVAPGTVNQGAAAPQATDVDAGLDTTGPVEGRILLQPDLPDSAVADPRPGAALADGTELEFLDELLSPEAPAAAVPQPARERERPSRARRPAKAREKPTAAPLGAPVVPESEPATLAPPAMATEAQIDARNGPGETTEVLGAPPEPSWQSLEPFLDLAEIESQLEPFGDRLRRIVTQLERALPGARARLLCLETEGAEGLGDGAVQILERTAAEEMPHYREALRRGETQFATSAPVGSDPAAGRIAAAVPLYVNGEPWGLLQVTWPQGHAGSVAELARLLAPLARLVAMAIQNQTTLEKLVFVDPLTGVYNRAFYDRQVTLEIERANRTNQKFALLVVDVDDFKTVNDRHGHRAGDQVLSQLARELRARMRKIDLMFRYGGEEFVLLLPGADLEEGQRTAERLRLVVSEQRFLADGVPSPLRVTVSIGGAVYPDQSRTKTGIFNAADTALYRAKHEGKNRVAF